MQNPDYGVLKGRVVRHEPQLSGNPHYSIFVEAGGQTYRIAFNIESVVDEEDAPPELQYFLDTNYRNGILQSFSALNEGFLLKSQGGPSLDFVRGNLFDTSQIVTLSRGTSVDNNPLYDSLVAAAETARTASQNGAFIVAFGMGFPASGRGRHTSFTQYSGLHDIHMNQGSRFDPKNPDFYRENGPNQDGALFFFLPEQQQWTALFVKFQSQDIQTDANGLPLSGRRPSADALMGDSTALRAFIDADTGSSVFKVHLLDVGDERYGDCILCQFGATTVLIDGAHPGDYEARGNHPSIPDQLGQLLGQQAPYHVSLLVVTHAHSDHIGCLPTLVSQNLLTADWALVADPGLGWGRSANQPGDAALPDRVRRLQAALREESRADERSDAVLTQFLDDVVNLESAYNNMLTALTQQETRVVRWGRDDYQPLEQQFNPIGLNILGPSDVQLLDCAEQIAQSSQATGGRSGDMLDGSLRVNEVVAYRRLAAEQSNDGDANIDASGGTGPAINNQSLILKFSYQNRALLFTGDMQFAQPQVATISAEMQKLHATVKANGPYDFVKIAHHGSYNAFNEAFLQEVSATKYFGICTGQNSPSHPSPKTLSTLDSHTNSIIWARTDRNGLTTFTFNADGIVTQQTRGELNDARPNTTDVELASVPVVLSAPPQTAPVITPSGGLTTQSAASTPVANTPPITNTPDSNETVEIIARIPHKSTRVTITVDIKPGEASNTTDNGGPGINPSHVNFRPLRIADGRTDLPKLLFVTSRDALRENITQSAADHLLLALRSQGYEVDDSLPGRTADINASVAVVRTQLRLRPDIKGVVILGGYDVVPALRLDVLEPQLKSQVSVENDPYDNFVIWSDGIYGDRDGDGLGEIAVSRIPDGKSADLMFKALEAGSRPLQTGRGIRNVNRPFADSVVRPLPGTTPLLTSRSTVFDVAYELSADWIYLMLHGDFNDATRFWGEEVPENKAAVFLSNVPAQCPGAVVFTGCCWAGLPVTTPANSQYTPVGTLPQSHNADTSLALRFLQSGARAFVGCTGSHYSPVQPPYNYFGKPLHDAFWQNCLGGMPPAQALFAAKTEYVQNIPHRTNASMLERALEYKIARQYTCLGLGW